MINVPESPQAVERQVYHAIVRYGVRRLARKLGLGASTISRTKRRPMDAPFGRVHRILVEDAKDRA